MLFAPVTPKLHICGFYMQSSSYNHTYLYKCLNISLYLFIAQYSLAYIILRFNIQGQFCTLLYSMQHYPLICTATVFYWALSLYGVYPSIHHSIMLGSILSFNVICLSIYISINQSINHTIRFIGRVCVHMRNLTTVLKIFFTQFLEQFTGREK